MPSFPFLTLCAGGLETLTIFSSVSMPDLIAHTNMDAPSVSRLREELSKMTQWLAKRIDRYLATEYEHAGQDYLETSKNGA